MTNKKTQSNSSNKPPRRLSENLRDSKAPEHEKKQRNLRDSKSPASKAASKAVGRPSKNGIALEQIIKTQKEAAEFAGVDVRTVRRWIKNNMPRTEKGWYIKSMLLFYKENEGSQHTEHKEKQAKAEAELKDTKAKLADLELKDRQGEFLNRDTVEKENTRKVLALKRALLGLGRKLAPQLARLKNPQKCQKLIDDDIRILIKDFSGQ